MTVNKITLMDDFFPYKMTSHEGDGEARKMPRDPGEQVVAVTR